MLTMLCMRFSLFFFFNDTATTEIYTLSLHDALPIYPDFFDRAGIYGDNGADYPDNARRFAFFCLAALTALPEIAPEAQLLHAHDWHTALAPVYLRTAFAGQPFYSRLASVLSVHNAGFQGHFPPETMAELGLPPELYTGDAFEWYGRMNMLKGGLAFSDVAVTVSPTHAGELRTPDGGFGLHDTFIGLGDRDRKSTRLNSSHGYISYAVFCLKKKK